jgi:hypothetical protein
VVRWGQKALDGWNGGPCAGEQQMGKTQLMIGVHEPAVQPSAISREHAHAKRSTMIRGGIRKTAARRIAFADEIVTM